ncbi:MAG TPA: APC family permease [Acidimicrobiia bacterium]|nr:APC family permease [Acidimicrobiia bacterium]
MTIIKRAFLGKPIASNEVEHQRISKKVALAVFSSDAISSTAYATQEILMVIALGASSLILGLDKLVPISIVVAILIAIVVSSYRKTIYAYPQGGGSYVVSKENLGENTSLVAGAAILVDYVLTVAVSTCAGVRAITSIPAFHNWSDHRVALCVGAISFITLINLRGAKESGKIFAIPTYVYVLAVGSLISFGLTKSYLGWFGGIDPIEFSSYAQEAAAEGLVESGGALAIIVLLRGFASGAVALTGIEAICDGVPAFRKPSAKNASRTLMMMAGILATLFFGISLLASRIHPIPLEEGESVFSQMGRHVFGEGPIYFGLQISTALILMLAANTAYADFPRLSSIIARDGFLPRQFTNRGDRLVFSNGVIVLGLAAIALVWIFGGTETALIPLYAVGVFTSFTLSQLGMVRYQLNPEHRSRVGAGISALGAFTTFVVLLVVAITKFTHGAWVSIVVVVIVVLFFKGVHKHYVRVQKSIAVPVDYKPQRMNHTVMVLVGRMHRGTLQALEYARSLAPNHLVAISVVSDEEERERVIAQWESFNMDMPLEIVYSPYRELLRPILDAVDDLDARYDNDIVTVVIPEFVVHRWWEHLLHNQSALLLKGRLLFRKNTVVTSVPYQVE